MSMPPYFYNYVNTADGVVNPSAVHVSGTPLARYYQKYLLQKAISRFDFTLPETWPKNYFLYVLFCTGYIGVVRTDKYGVIPQQCTLSGYNVFYQPREILVTNPLLTYQGELVLGRQAELIQLQPDYSGIMDIVTYYGDMMALASVAAGTNLLNSRLAYVFTAGNQAVAESFKKAMDRVLSGAPAVVVDKRLQDPAGGLSVEYFAQNLKENFIAPDIWQLMRQIEISFDQEIGIPNMNEQKKERQIVDEVNANNFETQAKVLLWQDMLQASCQRVNELFGTDIRVNLRKGEEAKLDGEYDHPGRPV